MPEAADTSAHAPYAPEVQDDILLARTMLIGGEWTGAVVGGTFPVHDAADGRVIVHAPAGEAADVDRAVAAARAAFAPGSPWRTMTLVRREAQPA